MEIRSGLLKPAIGDRHLEITTSVALDEDIANAIIRVAEHGESAEASATRERGIEQPDLGQGARETG